MTGDSWRRRALGRVVHLARRATPRLERAYARLPESAGLGFAADEAAHERRLVRYYRHLGDQTAALPYRPGFSLVVPAGADAAVTRASLRLQVWPQWEVVGDAAAASGDYIGWLAAGDRLYPNALAEVVRWLALHERRFGAPPEWLYTDERRIDTTGRLLGDPVLKPDWSPVLLRSTDYVGGLALYRRGFDAERVADAHERARAAGARAVPAHVPEVLVQRPHTPPSARPAPPRGRADAAACVVIPTRDQPDLLDACLTSVVTRTDHPSFQVVVVDNGTTDPAALAVLARHARDPRVRLIAAPGPFNFARLCRQGIEAGEGEVIVLLNNDTQVVTPAWLRTLVGYATEPGIGAVGPQLRYPDGRIQHAGLAGTAADGTAHLYVARAPTEIPALPREVLAVTGACLAVARADYEAVGGLDEDLLPNDSGDVDLCLRLRAAGRPSVYAPQAVLVHHEAPSRAESFTTFERFALQRLWPDELLNDPYLNPNLTRTARAEPDPRHPLPEVPADLFARWLAQGHV